MGTETGTAEVIPIRGDVRITKERLFNGRDEAVPRSNVLATAEEFGRKFTELGAIEPPFDPLALVRLFEISNSLRQVVDTMTTNIHGGGHTFERIFNWGTAEGRQRVRMAMILEHELKDEGFSFPSYQEKAEAGEEAGELYEPSEEEVTARIALLEQQAWRELETARNFFDFCDPKLGWQVIRERQGDDREVSGYGCFEVRRNAKGKPKRVRWIPGWTMRALPLGDPIKVDVRTRTTPITWGVESDWVEFRRFVQIVDGYEVFFKEFGDPRVLSSQTGKFYDEYEEHADNVAAFKKAEPCGIAATELWWSSLDNPESEIYGLIRWSGEILSVLGSREMEEINLLFFDNKTIPPMVFMISGGHVAKGAKEELKQVLRDEIKGSGNFHGCLIIEAEPSASSAVGQNTASQNQVKIDFKPLTDAIFKDQLWGEYDEANQRKVKNAFRLPDILVGQMKDFNKGTALAALRYANMQIFAPERKRFDDQINRTLMPAIGVSLWKFASVALVINDPSEIIPLIVKLVETTMRPEEAREIIAKMLAIDLAKVEAPWAKVPMKYALAGFTDEAPPADGDEPDLGDEDDDADDIDDAPDGDADGDADATEEAPTEMRLRMSNKKFKRLFEGD